MTRVAGSLRNDASRSSNRSSCYSRVVVLRSVSRTTIQREFVVELFLRDTLLFIQFSEDFFLNLIPSQSVSLVVLRAIYSVDFIEGEFESIDNLVLNRLVSDVEFDIPHSSNLVTNGICQQDTYQRFTAIGSRILLYVVEISGLLAVNRHTRLQDVLVVDNGVSTFRSLVVTYVITYQLIAIFETIIFNQAISSIYVPLIIYTANFIDVRSNQFVQIHTLAVKNDIVISRIANSSSSIFPQMSLVRRKNCLCISILSQSQFTDSNVLSLYCCIVRRNDGISTSRSIIMNLQSHYSNFVVRSNFFQRTISQVRPNF